MLFAHKDNDRPEAADAPPSSDLPFSPAEPYSLASAPRLVAIEHPAILSSIAAGIKTLGGQAGLATIIEDKDDARLELRYRPEDRYAHPIVSERVDVQNIVIKVDRNRTSQKIEHVEVVGVVEAVHRFRDMADFQHHPYPDSRFAKIFEETVPTLNYDKIKVFGSSMEEDDLSNLDLMPPPLFSKVTLPQIYNFRQNMGLVIKNGRLEYPNAYRNKFITMVDKDIPTTPMGPSKDLDPPNAITPAMRACIDRLQELFVARPISTRRTIFNTYLEKYGPGNPDVPSDHWRPILRFALPYVCYMFRSGPFRDAYVRHGIDPRKEAKWAGYQTAIFNFRTGNWRNQYVAPTETTDEINTKSHLFTGKDVGTKVLCFSFADILDPLVRKVLDESPLREKFDKEDGWYPTETLVKIRKIMRGKLVALRSGRIPDDDEFAPILLEQVTSGQETAEPETEEGVLEEDDRPVEGENVEGEEGEEEELERQAIANMENIVKQPTAHLITQASLDSRRKRKKHYDDEWDYDDD